MESTTYLPLAAEVRGSKKYKTFRINKAGIFFTAFFYFFTKLAQYCPKRPIFALQRF